MILNQYDKNSHCPAGRLSIVCKAAKIRLKLKKTKNIIFRHFELDIALVIPA